MNAVPQLLFDALSLGGIYAMAALGIALIFGVMKLVNFAHGEYIAFCVFALIVPSTDAVAVMFLGKAPAILLIPLLLLIGAAIAVASEFFVFRHMRNATPVAMMISSFALGFVIQNTLLLFYSSRPKAVSLWPELNQPVSIAGASIPLLQIIVICTTLLVVVTLALLLKRTRIGLEMRAAAEFHHGAAFGCAGQCGYHRRLCPVWRAGCRCGADHGHTNRCGRHSHGRADHVGCLHCHSDRRFGQFARCCSGGIFDWRCFGHFAGVPPARSTAFP